MSKVYFSYSRILRISIPIAVANATVPLIGVFDTGVVGQIGDPINIAAVGLGSLVISFMYWLFGFLRMGTTGLTSKARGEQDFDEELNTLVRSLIAGFAAGLILIIFHMQIIWMSMALFQATVEVENSASSYIKLRIWAAPFSIMMFSALGWLIAMERGSLVLLSQVITNALNILLDLHLVLNLEMGVKGVALASVIAEIFGGLLVLFFCFSALRVRHSLNLGKLFDTHKWNNMFFVNFNIFIRSSILEVVMVSFIYLSSKFGTITLAANQVLLHFLSISAYALDGFAFSAEVLVGMSIAEKSKKKVTEAVKKCTALAVSGAFIFSFLFLVFGKDVIDFMIHSQEVRNSAAAYLFWAALTPLTGVLAWILDGIFVGSTETSYMRKAMVQSFFFYLIIFLFVNVYLNNHALWLLINMFLVARAYFLFRYYPRIIKNCV